MAKKKLPTITIDSKKYKVHAGIMALDKFHDLAGRSAEELFEDVALEQKAKEENKKPQKKTRPKELAQFYYCTLKPLKHDVMTFNEFFSIIDEDQDVFKELTVIIQKQMDEKKD